MCRLEIDRWSNTAFECVNPTRHTDAPAVAGLEPREPPFRMRCHQIVAIKDGEIQKLAGGLHADGVLPDIFSTGATIAVTIKSGHRVAAAGFQFGSQNIRWHGYAFSVEALNRSSVEPCFQRSCRALSTVQRFNLSTIYDLGSIRSASFSFRLDPDKNERLGFSNHKP